MVSVGIGVNTVEVFRTDRKHSGLLKDSGNIVFPVEVLGRLGGGKVNTEFESRSS